MCILCKLGISGTMWSLINDCHSNSYFTVVVNQTSSQWFPISQGVRQGGVLSTFLYLVFIDELLLEIQNLSPNIGVFDIQSSNPTLADDICVIALTPRELQKVLDNIFQYSRRWRFTFNAAKSNVLHFHPSSCNPTVTFNWRLGKETIESSNAYNHLGILLSSNFDPGTRTSNSCRKGRQAYFAMKTSEQLNPITVAKLYKKVVLPSTLYGCELWCDLRAKDIKSLNTFQHFVAKHVMGLPKHTRSDMCENLLDLLPITAEIDIKKLQFFGRLCELNATYLTKRIFITRLFSYLFNAGTKHYGFIQDIIPILSKYNLHQVLTEYLTSGFFLNKSEWNKTEIIRHIISLCISA